MALPGNSPRRDWTRQELGKVLALYFRTPFGRLHNRNPEIRALASLIKRTPSAVALKLVNFASLDPDLRGRGRSGMQNASRLDRDVWDEYYGSWERLTAIDDTLESTTERATPSTEAPTEMLRELSVRRGQHYFRSVVLAAYENRCCVTDISISHLLRASHIVPWSVSTALRLEPRNGLCLNALHDAAFDSGLISIGKRLEVLVSRQVATTMTREEYHQWFGRFEGRPIRRPERLAPLDDALRYHRENIFIDHVQRL